MLAGTDSGPLLLLYMFAGSVITIAAAYRYWASRRMRPTFSTSRMEGTER